MCFVAAREGEDNDMTAPGAGPAEGGASEVYENVTCPFCGLLCDDIEVERTGSTIKVLKSGCPRSTAGFERVLPPAPPQIGGRDVDLK